MLSIVKAVCVAAVFCCVPLMTAPALAEELPLGTRLCSLVGHKTLFDLSMDIRSDARPGSPDDAHNQKITETFAKIEGAECVIVLTHVAVTPTGRKSTTFDEFAEVDIDGRKLWVTSMELGH